MKYGWFVVFIFCSLVAFAQKSGKVRDLEQQRKKALEEIEMTNQLLAETKKTARSSLNRLNLLSQQVLARKKVVNLLNQEIEVMDKQMRKMTQEIGVLGNQLKEKQKNYSKSVKSLYKRRTSEDKLLFILSADNFSQSLRRMRYLKEYADWQKKQANDIIEKRKEIAYKQATLQKNRAEKQALLNVRASETKNLQEEELAQKVEVQELNKKQRDLQAELKKKQQQASALNKQIEKLIAEEVARAEALAHAERGQTTRKSKKEEPITNKEESEPTENSTVTTDPEARVAAEKGGYAMTKEERKLSDSFAGNRGRLPFPVTGRYTIVSRFGEQQHQELKYVRLNNNGIDLQVQPGAEARAVFNGEVTRVFVVPGYNNSVIVRHGNYLTVYANLSTVYVKAGDKVTTRQPIGRIYSDLEEGNTTILHFQLWKEKTKLNPLPWLD
ncbi:murein hydrolase activator EnvC family protein [Parabacteroides pacaensis]|uniref:murein hydrolase activator EnvC family protein n=1 Tax=Parabacteroides pacaensis TaxID=2086575 RepID=UPI000D0E4A40|nr:peptidoglycan DD-metalloendopeptidase family protein [Parabacteroides pacaensis]